MAMTAGKVREQMGIITQLFAEALKTQYFASIDEPLFEVGISPTLYLLPNSLKGLAVHDARCPP